MRWCPILVAPRLVDGERLETAKKDAPCNDPDCQWWELCHPTARVPSIWIGDPPPVTTVTTTSHPIGDYIVWSGETGDSTDPHTLNGD